MDIVSWFNPPVYRLGDALSQPNRIPSVACGDDCWRPVPAPFVRRRQGGNAALAQQLYQPIFAGGLYPRLVGRSRLEAFEHKVLNVQMDLHATALACPGQSNSDALAGRSNFLNSAWTAERSMAMVTGPPV